MYPDRGKRAAAAAVCLLMILGVVLCGCREQASRPLVTLSVWWSDDGDRELVEEMIEAFQKEHEKEALFEITVSKESVMNLKARYWRIRRRLRIFLCLRTISSTRL